MGIDQALLYPTWFAEGAFRVRDPDLAYAPARADNGWIADFRKPAPARLYAAAMRCSRARPSALANRTRCRNCLPPCRRCEYGKLAGARLRPASPPMPPWRSARLRERALPPQHERMPLIVQRP
jgi:hypothetical protein